MWSKEKPIGWGFGNRCKWSWKDTAKYETTHLRWSKSLKTVYELASLLGNVKRELFKWRFFFFFRGGGGGKNSISCRLRVLIISSFYIPGNHKLSLLSILALSFFANRFPWSALLGFFFLFVLGFFFLVVFFSSFSSSSKQILLLKLKWALISSTHSSPNTKPGTPCVPITMTAGSLRIWGADPRWCTDPARGAPSSTPPKSRSSTTEHRRSPAPLTNRIPAPWRAMGTPATSMATTPCKGRACSARRTRTWCSTRTASSLPAASARSRRARSRALLRPSSSPGCDRKVSRDGKDSERHFPSPESGPLPCFLPLLLACLLSLSFSSPVTVFYCFMGVNFCTCKLLYSLITLKETFSSGGWASRAFCGRKRP